MIYLFCSGLVLAGLVAFALGLRASRRVPPSLRYRCFNEEVLGVALILAGLWTMVIYALVEVIKNR